MNVYWMRGRINQCTEDGALEIITTTTRVLTGPMDNLPRHIVKLAKCLITILMNVNKLYII